VWCVCVCECVCVWGVCVVCVCVCVVCVCVYICGFLPSIVIQLRNVNQQNALIKLNNFFLSSTCFEHSMFVISNTILYMQPYTVCDEHTLQPARLLA